MILRRSDFVGFAGDLDPWPADDKAVGVAGYVALQMWLEVPSTTPLKKINIIQMST